MKKILLITISLFILISCTLNTENKVKSKNYNTYLNERFAFKINYPKELLIPQPPPMNGDGREFYSAEKDVEMLVFGSHNALLYTPETAFQEELENYKEDEVVYKKYNNDFFVISGYKKDKIFYKKVLLNKNDKGDLITSFHFYIEYPKSKKKIWDKVVEKCVNSFK